MEKNSKSNENSLNHEESTNCVKYGPNATKNESDDENKNLNTATKSTKKTNTSNKKTNSNKHSKNASDSNWTRGPKFEKKTPNKQQQNQNQSVETGYKANQSDLSLPLNNSNSVQCLRETQVPLYQYKNSYNSNTGK